MFPCQYESSGNLTMEESAYTLLRDGNELSESIRLIQEINERIFQKYQEDRLSEQSSRCYIRHKEAIFGSVCGLIAVSVMAIWASQTLPGEIKAILEPSIHLGGHQGNDSLNSTFLIQHLKSNTVNFSSDYDAPTGLIIYPIVKFTASAHGIGQLATWLSEFIGLDKPALSLKELRLLTQALRELRKQRDETLPLIESSANDVGISWKSALETGENIFSQEKKTHLKNGLYLTILAVEAVLIYYICIWAFNSIDKISESFLKGTFGDSQSGSSNYMTTASQANSSSPEENIGLRILHNVTNGVFEHLEKEMHGPIQKTVAVGVFTSLTATATTLLAKIPSGIKSVYQRCLRADESTEPQEFSEVAGQNYIVVDMS